MKIEKIKPVPQKIVSAIRRLDKKEYPKQDQHVRFYAYMAKNDKELVKITVAVKNYQKQWFYKQVIVHGVHSDKCFLKDIRFTHMSGYSVGWYDEGIQKQKRWYEDAEWGWQYDEYFNPWAPVVNINYIVEHFPEYKYSAIDQYNYLDTLQYLRIYERYPQAEYLVKMGLHYYATCKSVLRLAAKDKAFRKWIFNHKNELTKTYAQTVLEAYKTGRPIEETQILLQAKKVFARESNSEVIKELFKGKDLERFFLYIAKQKTTFHTYLDYINACRYLGLDLTQEKNLLPHDFKRWHDIRIDEYHSKKMMEVIESKKHLIADFKKAAEKYLSLQYDKRNDYIAIIAMSPADLIREGNELHHCVGKMGYDMKMIRGESLIFFIRAKAEPEKPLVTVEYSPSKKMVLQCYADHNATPDETVMEFVKKKWLPFANRQVKMLAA